MENPWRAKQFGTGYSGEFQPPGQFSWRFVKERGDVKVFHSARDALVAAKDEFLRRFNSTILTSVVLSDDEQQARMEAKMKADAESWLKSSRKDVKDKEIIRRSGKRPLSIMRGRA